MNYSDLERMQEATNEAMCRHAFALAHPKEPVSLASECDAGSWNCADCPWKDTATLHSGCVRKWAILINTLIDGITIGDWVTDEHGVRTPFLFDTEAEANAANADDMANWLDEHPDESEDDFEFYVEPVFLFKDGSVIHEYTRQRLFGATP